jgi:uncharacterized RDD family membrane protein YckC
MPLKYAAPWKRGAAFLIDAAMAAPLAGVSPVAAAGVLALAGTLFEASTWQATPGKRWLGLRVMEAHGRRVDWRRAAARQAVRALPLALWTIQPHWEWLAAAACGALIGAVGGRGRTLWDRAAGTSVIAPPLGAEAQEPYGANA